MICPTCKINLIKKRIKYNLLGETLGIFPAEICPKCKEQFLSKEISEVIEKIAKEKGLWELKHKTKISKVGNSLSIRLNKKLASFFKINKGKEVTLYPENKNTIIVRIN